jgi:hypothetical protein
VRWQRLLVGQGIHAPWRFLGSSFMIARFWGAFTPGGFTGFGGWRIFDIADRTGKFARASAVIGVEMILGQLAFGVVVMLGSVFGFGVHRDQRRGAGERSASPASSSASGLTFLARPHLFRVHRRLSSGEHPRAHAHAGGRGVRLPGQERCCWCRPTLLGV